MSLNTFNVQAQRLVSPCPGLSANLGMQVVKCSVIDPVCGEGMFALFWELLESAVTLNDPLQKKSLFP